MKTVLAVDDERLICWALCQALKNDFLFMSASSVEEALNILGRVPVDAVVTDLRMPDKSGVELVEALRKRAPGVKIFVLSAYVTEPLEELLKARGVRMCLSKPFDVAEVRKLLLRELGETAEGERRHAASV